MISSIVQIIAVLLGVIGVNWIANIVNKYWQAYQDYKNSSELAEQKKALENELRRRAEEHKKLKDIEDKVNGK